MGWLKKEEKVTVVRDPETGKFIGFERQGDTVDPEVARKRAEAEHIRQMTREYKIKEAERKAMARAKQRAESAKRKKKMKIAIRESTAAGRMAFSGPSRKSSTGKTGPSPRFVVRGGVAYPVAQRKKKKKPKSISDEFSFSSEDFTKELEDFSKAFKM